MRLLLATLAVSVAMLLLLARYRFPEEAARQTVESAPAPLERLAARATFDELASIMADLERRILPSIVTVAGQSTSGTIYAPGVRLAPNRAVALVSGERRIGPRSDAEPPVIIFRDAARDLVVLETPTVTDAVPPLPSSTASRPGPRYFAVVETTGAGHAVRPVYIGRTDLFTDPRWSDPVLRVAAVQQTLSPGSAVFSLDGTFIGLATESAGRVMIVPALTLRGIAVGAGPAPAVQADLPLDVQPLSPSLSRASGAERGVMVSYVRESKATIAAGDVIQMIDGIDVMTVGGYQLVAQSRKPGAPVMLAIVRRGQPLAVAVTAVAADAAAAPPRDDEPGAVLRSVPGAGTEVVAVEPRSAAARAGLRRGDLIVGADTTSAPDSGSILKSFDAAKPGTFLLLTIRREGEHQVVALEKR
jgi:S1-C subfamily serine protease